MSSESFVEKLTSELNASGASVELLAFAVSNAALLQNLGADTVAMIMDRLAHNDSAGAHMLLDLQFTPDQIIAREQMNAQEMAADTAMREKFFGELKAFGIALMPVLIKVGISMATGGTIL